jgi:hemoglobin-like flavoprotein
MTVITKPSLKCFQESLRRISQKPGFYDCFYDSFMAQSEEIAQIFNTRDMDLLKHKLQETLQMVDSAVEGKPGIVIYLEMLGRIHQRLKVDQRHFEMWQDALMHTVKHYDDEFDPQVQAAWEDAIQMVLDLMYPEATDRVSSR